MFPVAAAPAKPSLEELFRNVPQEKLNQPCQDGDLAILSLSITDWQAIAPFLGLTEAEEEAIKVDCASEERRRIAMLRKWKGNLGKKATYKKLAKLLYTAGRTDVVDKLCEILECDSSSGSGEEIPECIVPPDVPDRKQGSPGNGQKHVKGTQRQNLFQRVWKKVTKWHVRESPPEMQPNTLLNSYAVYLRGRYRAQNPAFLILQWPPPPTRKVFNLAMILHENIQHGPVDEELVRLTLRGNVDDIMRQNVAVSVEDVITQDKADRKVILIEGAPGAGKSTLAWHIPHKWARGELFQEFEVVVFIQLRDPEIQAAQCLADLLPARDRTAAKTIASALRASNGRSTLFVLDSWDEFTPQLQPCSLFEQLICCPEHLNLHMSTVLITSRPVAAGVLYRRISSRVKIVGFTPSERKQYFTEVLRGDVHKVQKLEDHLRERPVIEASCYLPLNAAIVAHLFLTLSQTLPTTLHGVFTSLVICCLIRHMQREGRAKPISSFEDLPEDIQQPFKNICTLAYHGVMKNKVTFSALDLQSFNLPSELSTLSLIQGVESLTTYQRTTFYSFLHLSIQELLAAFHISQLPESEQIHIFNKLFEQPRFAAVFQYYAAFTRLQTEGIRGVISNIIKTADSDIFLITIPPCSLLHCLYEAQDLSLCQFVASQLIGGVSYFTVSLSPVDCLALGYFLRSVCLTTRGEFNVRFDFCPLYDNRVSFLARELSKCDSSSGPSSMAVTDGGAPGGLNLDLSGHVGEPEMKEIADLLIGCSLITQLSLEGCQITRNGAQFLSEAFKVNKTLVKVKISQNDLGDDGIAHISHSLTINTSLRELHLRLCDLTEEGIKLLSQMLVVNRSLAILNISDNDLRGDIAHMISHSLTINTTLREFHLCKCNLTEEGIKSLSQMLVVNRSLAILNISDNDLRGDIAHISHSLTINTTLRELQLRDCRLTEEGFKSLSQMLEMNQSLRVLSLECNSMSDTGVTFIATSLRVNSTLEELDLSKNYQFTDTGLVALGDCLKNNGGLKRLRLNDLFKLSCESLRQFVLCLQENCHLTELELDGAEIVQHETELANQLRQRGLVVTGKRITEPFTMGPTLDSEYMYLR